MDKPYGLTVDLLLIVAEGPLKLNDSMTSGLDFYQQKKISRTVREIEELH